MTSFRPRTPTEAKQIFLKHFSDGKSISESIDMVGRVINTYDYWRKSDAEFKHAVDFIRARRAGAGLTKDPGTFAEFSKKYLLQPVFNHQLQWVDLLEGHSPRGLHAAQTYAPGRPGLVIVNTPPEHCAVVDTPVLTSNGWKTIGEVDPETDWLFGPDGIAEPVIDAWAPETTVPVFRVTFNTGDTLVTDAGHKWLVSPYNRREDREVRTTAELAADLRVGSALKWRVRVADPVEFPERDLPLDPYLFGYWLGDGDKGSSRISVGDEDTDALLGQIELAGYTCHLSRDSRGRSNVAYVHKIRHLLPLGDKTIPAEYLTSSAKQRLALLQGLLDSDGTICAKSGRVKWVQHHRPGLCRDVFRLIASLGYQPRIRTYGIGTEVTFKPDSEPVFRLDRKAARQFTRIRGRRTDYRTIVSVEPVGEAHVRCLTVATDGNTYLVGDGLVETGNAKSTTLTVNYATYRVCKDPNVRIIVVSKTKEMATRFLYAIKNRLTHPRYRQLQIDFAPENGFASSADMWRTDQVYLGSEQRDSGEKDPTLLALGIGGQIYGARADLIIVDDAVTLSNAHEYEKQLEWLQQEVITRLGPGGRLLLIGTRVAPQDLYSEAQDPNRYADLRSPWTYLSQPAVLEFHDDPAEWKTLWPETYEGVNLVPKWDGRALHARRGVVSPRTWAMAYQQQQVVENAVFDAAAVKASVNGSRMTGPIPKGVKGCRPQGMEGLYLVAGLDPAMTGHTAAVLLGVDRATRRRFVLDMHNQPGMTPASIRELIKTWTVRYGIHEWRVEKNAFQGMLTQDEYVRTFLNDRGCVLKEHFTGNNKWDVDFGVASCATLFDGWDDKPRRNLIELPSSAHSGGEVVKQFMEQLITWAPETKGKTDLVMAFWFAEIRAREVVDSLNGKYHFSNRYATPRDLDRRLVVNLDDFWTQQQENRISA